MQVGPIDLRGRVAFKDALARVADDAGDGQAVVARRPGFYAFADRINVRKVASHEGLVDQDDMLRAFRVPVVEETPLLQRNPHRLEVIRADSGHRDGRFLPEALWRPALDTHGRHEGVIRHRQMIGQSGELSARQRLEPLENGLEEARRPRPVLTLREVDLQGQDAFRPEARIDRAQADEAPHHQAGADEEYEGEGDF